MQINSLFENSAHSGRDPGDGPYVGKSLLTALSVPLRLLKPHKGQML